MAHAIGCLGMPVTLTTLRTSGKRCVAERKYLPKRNQNRALAVISIKRADGTVKVRGIRDGQLAHYKAAYYFADVDYMLGNDGKRIIVKARRKA